MRSSGGARNGSCAPCCKPRRHAARHSEPIGLTSWFCADVLYRSATATGRHLLVDGHGPGYVISGYCSPSSWATRTGGGIYVPAGAAWGAEREAVRLVADGDPAPLGELVPAALRPEPGAVARGAGAAERGVRVIVQCLVVDVHDAGVELVRHGPATVAGTGLDGRDQAVLGVVRDRDRLGVVLDDRDRRDRAKALLPERGHLLGHPAQHGRGVVQPVVG